VRKLTACGYIAGGTPNEVFLSSVVCGKGKQETREVGAVAGSKPMLVAWECPVPLLLWVPSHILVS
jgi:hypothetical protein